MTACTEKEAAEKWCPHVRKPIVDPNWNMFSGNMSADGTFATCIGSRCMQWRWDTELATLNMGDPPRGYCGLAGKP
jgi:hypothetical protein